MASDLPSSFPAPPTIEEILAELRAREEEDAAAFEVPGEFRPPAARAQTPEEAGILAKVLHGLGVAQAATQTPFRYVGRKVYQAQFPEVPEEKIPSLEEMAVGAVAPPEGPGPVSPNRRFAQRLAEIGAGTLIDPTTMALVLGGGGLVKGGLGSMLRLGLLGSMGYGVVKSSKALYDELTHQGWTNTAAEHAADLVADAALIIGPEAARRMLRGETPARGEEEGGAPMAPRPPEAPPGAPPAAPGRPIGPRLPYERPTVGRATDRDLAAWKALYDEGIRRGLDPETAMQLADDSFRQSLFDVEPPEGPAPPREIGPPPGPPPGEPPPPRRPPPPKDMGPQPGTEVDRLADPVLEATRQSLLAALDDAIKAGDWAMEGFIRRQLGDLEGVVARAKSAPKPPGPPPPGEAGGPPGTPGPPTPMGGPGGVTYQRPGPAVPPSEPPGPRGGTTVTPTVPPEVAAPGEVTPIEGAAGRAEAQRPGVRDLTKAGQQTAAGLPVVAPPPGIVVGGPTEGAGAGGVTTPTIPPGPPLPGIPAPPLGAPPLAPPLAAPPAVAPPQPTPTAAPGMAPPLAPPPALGMAPPPGMAPGVAPVAPLPGPAPPARPPIAAPVRPPPVQPAAPQAPQAVPPEPEPRRRLRIGRGAHGQVEVVFPDLVHADLYSLPGRSRRVMQGEGGTRDAEWLDASRRQISNVLGIPPERVYEAAYQYKDRINRAIRALPEDDRFEAPRWDEPEEEIVPPMPLEVPREAIRGDIGRGAVLPDGGQRWIVRLYDDAGKTLVESEPYVNKNEAQAELRRLQPELKRNRTGFMPAPPPPPTAPPRPAPAPTPPPTPTGVPAFIPKNVEQALADLGWSRDQRNAKWMTPERAQQIIKAEQKARDEKGRPLFDKEGKPITYGEPSPGMKEAAEGLEEELTGKKPKKPAPPPAPEKPPELELEPTKAPPAPAPEEKQPFRGFKVGDQVLYHGKVGTIRELLVAGKGKEARERARVYFTEAGYQKRRHEQFVDIDKLQRKLEPAEVEGRKEDLAKRSPVEGVEVVYRSGMSRRGDLQAAAAWETPFGVDINELTEPAMRQIGRAIGNGWDPRIFVDSGAFAAYKKGETQDIDAIIAKYQRLLDVITEENPNEEEYPPLLLVVPDVIGDQAATLQSFRDAIPKMGKLLGRFRPVFPLQTGELALEQFIDEVMNLGTGGMKGDPVWGIPSHAEAAPLDEIEGLGERLRELADEFEDERPYVHFLGAGSEKTLRPLLRALGEGLYVTADSNALRAKIGAVEGGREGAIRDILGAEPGAGLGTELPPVEDLALPEEPITPEDVPAPPAKQLSDVLSPEAVKAVEVALKRIGDTPELRKAVVEQVQRLRVYQEARKDWEYFAPGGTKIVNRAKKRQGAKQRMDSASTLYEVGWEALQHDTKDVPDAVAALKRIRQVIEGRGLRGEPVVREALPITTYAYRMAQGWVEHVGEMTMDQAVERIKEYAAYYAPTDEDLLIGLENLAGRIQSLSTAALKNAVDIPGLGRTTIAAALAQGPDHPKFRDILEYRRRAFAEEEAFAELVTEHQEPAHHLGLNGIADALGQDLAYQADHPDEVADPPLMKTFMWGIRDPATGEQITTEEAISAIREGRGRTYARILSAYRDAAGVMKDDVPFDIPEGDVEDEDIQEAPVKKYQQKIVPGFLDAVVTTPQKPTARPGKPSPTFEDSELFTQEERKRERDLEEKEKKAQLDLFKSKVIVYQSAPQDEFGGRYGPPPRRPTPEQLAARQRWLAKLRGEGGAVGPAIPPLRPAAAAGAASGEAAPEVLRPELGGAAEPEREGEDRGPRGGGRGLGGVSPGRGARGAAPAPEGRTSRRGIFTITDPREEATFTRPPKYDLIPARLRGFDANGDAYLSPEQQVGVAKAIEAMEAGSGFLFEDGTGVGKTRELLAVAHHFAGKGNKVLIVSKASAIEPVKDPVTKKLVPSGSYADDSEAMGIPLVFTRERTQLEPGKIYLGTYHDLRNYVVDKDTVLLLDEAHMVKNAGDSERAAAGIDLIRQAKVTAFATATPGDKPYHLLYLTSIGLLEGQDMETAMRKLGCVVKVRERFSEALYKKLVNAGEDATKARFKATEKFPVWKTTSTKKMHQEMDNLFERLTAQGTVVKREVDLSSLDVRGVLVDLPPEGMRAMDLIEQAKPNRRDSLMHMRWQQEPFKLAKVQDLVRAELAEGRQVVIFAARVERSDVVERHRDPYTGQLIEHVVLSSEGTLRQLSSWLTQEGIPFAEIHGGAKESTKTAQERFQRSQARVVIATYERGGTGINLDDRTGAAPRTMIMMTAPFESTSVVQAIGRIHRFTTRSPGRVHMLFTDHGVDKWNARILVTKLKMLRAVVSGDIDVLDAGILGGGEEALQAGTVHYRDAMLKLLDQGPAAQMNKIRSAKHWGYIVHMLKRLGVKVSMRGGDFEILTHEGFTITGSLDRSPQLLSTYGHFRWEHDEDATDLVKTISVPAGPQLEAPRYDATYLLSVLRDLSGGRYADGQAKPMVSEKQHKYHEARLRGLGAVLGFGGKPGSWMIVSKDNYHFVGELIPPKLAPGESRANPGDEGRFSWERRGSENIQMAAAQTYDSRQALTRLVRRIEKGASFRDLYTRHQPILRELFGNDYDLFTRILAIVFHQTDTKGSMMLALKAYRQMRYGVAFTGFLPTVKAALDRLARGEPDYVRGPKMRPFTAASTNEDIHAMAVDRHVGRFVLGDSFDGTPAQIRRVEAALRAAQKVLGWTGREIQAAAWAARQMEAGKLPEEIQTYDQILVERASEIRRFRAYFGDVAGPRAWTPPALSALENRQKSGVGSLDPGLERAGDDRQQAGLGYFPGLVSYERPLLAWAKPLRAGKGLRMEPGVTSGVRVVWSALKEGFINLGRIDWDGLHVGDLESVAAIYQVARNPSLEHGTIFILDGQGRVLSTFQSTSRSPTFVAWGPIGEIEEKVRKQVAHLRAAGKEPKAIIGAHNHPSGDSTPSAGDYEVSRRWREAWGDLYAGDVVIDHEQAGIITPDGKQYRIRRANGRFVDPDPFLSDDVDAAAIYHPDSTYKIHDVYGFKAWAEQLLARGYYAGDDTDSVALFLLDSSLVLKFLVMLPRQVYQNEGMLLDLLSNFGRGAGAATNLVAMQTPDLLTRAATIRYVRQGLVQDAIVFGEPTSAYRALERMGMAPAHKNLPWLDIVRVQSPTGDIAFQLSPVDSFDPDEVARPAASSGGGAGLPPPPPPTRPGPDPSDEDDEWWQRRVRYARARVAARMREAAAFIDPRAFWDAFVLGVDAVLRGFRSFGRWLAEMARSIFNIRQWGRRLWESIRSIGTGVVIERPGRPRPFGEIAGEAELGVRGRPIRPIPEPRDRDIIAAIEAMLRPETPDPGTGRPIGVGRPGDLAINIHTIVDEAGIRDAWVRIIRALEARFGVARGRQTEAEIRLQALESGLTLPEYLRLVREHGALRSYEIHAGRVLRQEFGIDFVNKFAVWQDAVRRAAEEGITAAEEASRRIMALDAERESRAALQKLIAIMYATAGAASEAGRALRAHGMLAQSLTPHERYLQHLFRGTRPDERLMARLIDALRRNDMAEAGRITRQLHRPGFWRTIGEYFINSLISAPSTPAANVMGNLVHEALLRTPERGIAAQLERFGIRQTAERVLRGEVEPTERVVGEMTAALRAQVKYRFGLLQALKFSWEALGNEDVRFMTGLKGEYYPPAIPGILGKVVRTPGRVMEALDLGARHSAMAGERAAQVWRKVYFEAHERGGYDRARFEQRVNEVNRDLERWIELEDARIRDAQRFQAEYGQEGYTYLFRHREFAKVYEAMKRAGAESTFRDETTKFTSYIKAMRGTYPWLVFLVPFIHTPERILVQALRRTPVGLAKTLWNIRQGKIKGGQASDRLAQGILGTMVSGAIYMAAKQGLITGGGPADPDKRRDWLKTGKQPYAIRVGEEWISLARIEPLATTLGFAADLAEAQDEKIAGDVFDKLHYSVLNNITNKTYLQGIVSAAEAVGDPDRYGARLWKQMVGAAVPNLLAAAARSIDPTIRQTDSIQDTLMARIPVLSSSVPARLTGTGEPVVRGETAVSRFVSPFRYSKEAGPEANLERMFLRTGYSPSAPPKAITLPGTMGRRVDLTPGERRIYARYASRATAFARTLTANHDWSGLDVYAQEELLRRIYRFAHDAARREMMASVLARLRRGEAAVAARR